MPAAPNICFHFLLSHVPFFFSIKIYHHPLHSHWLFYLFGVQFISLFRNFDLANSIYDIHNRRFTWNWELQQTCTNANHMSWMELGLGAEHMSWSSVLLTSQKISPGEWAKIPRGHTRRAAELQSWIFFPELRPHSSPVRPHCGVRWAGWKIFLEKSVLTHSKEPIFSSRPSPYYMLSFNSHQFTSRKECLCRHSLSLSFFNKYIHPSRSRTRTRVEARLPKPKPKLGCAIVFQGQLHFYQTQLATAAISYSA